MSKRRQTIGSTASVTDHKKSKLDDSDCTDVPVADLTNKQLRKCLEDFGEIPGREKEHVFKYYCLIDVTDITSQSLSWEDYHDNIPGPVMPSTRTLYERQLEKYRNGQVAPKENKTTDNPPLRPSFQSTPARPETKGKSLGARASKRKGKLELADDSSPEKLSPVSTSPPVDIESLPEPPSATRNPRITTPKIKRTPLKPTNHNQINIESLSNKEVRDMLVAKGDTPGPVNDKNRKLYNELLAKHLRSGQIGNSGRRMSSEGNGGPIHSSTRIDQTGERSGRANRTRPIVTGSGDNFPQTIHEGISKFKYICELHNTF